MEPTPAHETSGPSLRLIFGILIVLVVGMGVLAYYRYVQSENHFVEASEQLKAAGAHEDVEGCIDQVLSWHERCEANRPLCDHIVPKMMMLCLSAQDRSRACDALDMSSARAQWVFRSCRDRGTPCKSRKKCPCADSYRALDSFCRHGQQGVAM